MNPLQFGPGEDLDRYPRTLDADLEVCAREGVDIVFAPSVEEVYPGGAPQVTVQPGPLAEVLEGKIRPGHFRGVLTVVAKLFGLVRPDVAVFGQKDYQQLVLIRRMVLDLNMGVEVVGAETVREADGLALSSRNRYLDPEQRSSADRAQPRAPRRPGRRAVRRRRRARRRARRAAGRPGRGPRLPGDHRPGPRRAARRRTRRDRGPGADRRARRHHPADRQRCRSVPRAIRRGASGRSDPDAAHHDEEQDPPGHGHPGRPALRRVGDRRRGPARRRRPAARRAGAHRRHHQRRPARDLHDRRRARLRRDRHQRRRGPAGAPRRPGDPDRLRADGDRRGEGAPAARGLRRRRQQDPGHRVRPGRGGRRAPVWSAATS